MSLVLNGSGTITGLTAGGLPDGSIVQADLATGVAGTGPAFSAYQSSAQTLTGSTYTKLQFQTEEFDTNSNFDSTTNYRFTPTVAGYYQITGEIVVGASATQGIITIYKNGSEFKRGMAVNTAVGAGFLTTALIYLNGRTDYVELYGYIVTGQILASSAAFTYFQGVMVRAA